jgi:hypothetical protein
MRDANRTTFVASKVKQQDVRRRRIGRNRDGVNVANCKERLDIWLVRMSGQGIAKEDDGVDFGLDDARADLDVATFRPGRHALDV